MANSEQNIDCLQLQKNIKDIIDSIKPGETPGKKDEKMVLEIEKEQASHKDDVELEYFVDGKRKFYVPSHPL